MNHQEYEAWLFASLEQDRKDQGVEPLTPEQQAALGQHLSDCDSCRQLAEAWQVVESEIRQAPQVAPAPGFTSRWQETLLAERRRLERRQTLAMLAFVAGAVVLLTGSLAVLTLPAIQRPVNLFWAWLYEVLSLVEVMDTAGDIGRALLISLPLPAWILFVGLVTELAVLWLVSLRVLTQPRSVEN